MLTGRETVPAAFAAMAWQQGWRELVDRVRHLALGLGDVGGVPAPTTTAGALAVLSVGGVLDFDVPAEALFEDALVAAGREIDDEDPDAFERRWRAVGPGDVAARGDNGREWTHGALLWAARSFAQGIEAKAGDRIRLDDELDGVRSFVLRSLVPAVSGAVIAELQPDVFVWPAADAIDLLRPAIAALPNGRLRGRGAAREARAALGLASCRLVLVTGEAGVAVDWLEQIGVAAEPLTSVPAVAAPICGARPFPGVTVAVADDGEVLVRADFVATGAYAEDGWLHTGEMRAWPERPSERDA